MELFEDGGLKDEGNTIDPVSGNDVPPGSTQEEVRDDIPAQLSEGEFVFPADVVRYIGLEKLMQMRQQAKMGLQTMDDMGQMGNSEEAIMPDNLPFELTDLDMDDEEEYNNDTVEMAVGGLLGPATGISGYVPSQVPATSFVSQPQAPVTPTVQQPTQATTPIAPTYTPPTQQAVPTFTPEQMQDVSYPGVIETPESAPQLVEIINPTTGEKRTITYIPGVTQLPEGFVLASEYTAPETPTVTPTLGQAQVRKDDDDDPDDPDPLKQQRITDRINVAKGLFGDTFSYMNPLTELAGAIIPYGLGSKLYKPGQTTSAGYVVGQDGNLYDPLTQEKIDSSLISRVINKLKPEELDPYYVDAFKKQLPEDVVKELEKPENLGKALRNAKTQKEKVALARIGSDAAVSFEDIKAPPKKETSDQKTVREAKDKKTISDRVSSAREKAIKKEADRTGKSEKDVREKEEADTEAFNTGGLLSKPKPKPKQMRSGGLASKK